MDCLYYQQDYNFVILPDHTKAMTKKTKSTIDIYVGITFRLCAYMNSLYSVINNTLFSNELHYTFQW